MLLCALAACLQTTCLGTAGGKLRVLSSPVHGLLPSQAVCEGGGSRHVALPIDHTAIAPWAQRPERGRGPWQVQADVPERVYRCGNTTREEREKRFSSAYTQQRFHKTGGAPGVLSHGDNFTSKMKVRSSLSFRRHKLVLHL